MHTSNIVLNENNLSLNGVFNASSQQGPYNKLYLTTGSQSLNGKKVALQKLNLYYSWPNINNTNNTFSISWPTGTGAYSNFSVKIPSNTNFATIAELNDYLQTVMIANNLYAINSTTGDFLYFMSIVANPNTYGVNLIQSLVPTSTPLGYSTPPGFIGWPTVSRTMRFITDTSDFNLLIGYAANTTFDGNTSAITYSSSFTPQFSPVSSFNIHVNIASNPLALNNDNTIIYTATTRDTKFGSILSIEPNNIIWYDINSNFNTIIVSFTDQSGRALQIQDPQISVVLLLSDV